MSGVRTKKRTADRDLKIALHQVLESKGGNVRLSCLHCAQQTCLACECAFVGIGDGAGWLVLGSGNLVGPYEE